MYNFNPFDYIELTERDPDPILQQHMDAELRIIKKIKNSNNKTFVDLGAGHGRIINTLALIAKKVIGIDINYKMISELEERAKKYSNIEIVEGDITNLKECLKGKKIDKPVLLLLQNTLGTIEGNREDVLFGMKKVAKELKGEIIISLFRQEALKSWGLELYEHNKVMSGEPDFNHTDFKNGIYWSKTGYNSKWWSEKDIDDIKKLFGGKIENEIWTHNYYVGHISYSD